MNKNVFANTRGEQQGGGLLLSQERGEQQGGLLFSQEGGNNKGGGCCSLKKGGTTRGGGGCCSVKKGGTTRGGGCCSPKWRTTTPPTPLSKGYDLRGDLPESAHAITRWARCPLSSRLGWGVRTAPERLNKHVSR